MQMLCPSDLGESLAALAVHPHATLLAGGTDLMVEINLRHQRPETVIGLRRVGELARVDARYIGAMATYQRLQRSGIPALAELSRTVGSPQIRAAGTIGGNLGTASPAGDALPFLAALDAEVELASAAGRRRLRWDEFLLGPKRNALAPGELICGVVLPPVLPARQAFAKIGQRQAMVIAAVSCCVVRDDDGATRVALGAVGPTVLRTPKAEALVSGEAAVTPAVLDEFQRLVSLEVQPITDHRSTAEYRRHAAGVLARRTLERCLQP
jgi:CO/xanthine dehydrogenase FAD-binding subunit